jgi:hypothetical protein
MRQAQDPVFQDLLSRARTGILTEHDISLLNTKVTILFFIPELEKATTVVKLNTLCHYINCIQIEKFAQN